ncbi:MAG: DUF2206 domain-containing protein, partial [Patescibacteria group bacterium]|nr:DUF2206 domain-containing protein [Patescibacteria group bacterium]
LGLSLLELIGVGLISNTLLPFFGETRPLDKDPILALLTLLVVTLATIYWFRLKEEVLTINLFKTWNIRDSMVAFAPLMFVALSINGASYLNAGDTGTTTLLMLIGAALYSGALIYYSNRLKGDVTLTALFFIGLALLLMTSLRGYFIVGHDIQNEFRVFEFARQMGFWTIDTYRDAYNACMSITILPTIFANLLHLPAPYVFKALFQVLFAFVPPMVFLIVRRYISTRMALIAALYFVAFPTFFTDMPFLNRQEIAFIFLALMFLIGFDERLAYRTRQLLFVVFGAGMILSHYSTTYTIIALLGLLIVARPIFRLVSKFLPKQLQNTTVAALAKEVKTARPQVTLWMVVVLAGLSFFWSSVLTDTSSNSLYRVITKTVAAMQSAYVEDTRSSDVLYSLFSWEKPDPQVLFGEYKAAALERVSEEPDK